MIIEQTEPAAKQSGHGSYSCYPFGFYRRINLPESYPPFDLYFFDGSPSISQIDQYHGGHTSKYYEAYHVNTTCGLSKVLVRPDDFLNTFVQMEFQDREVVSVARTLIYQIKREQASVDDKKKPLVALGIFLGRNPPSVIQQATEHATALDVAVAFDAALSKAGL